MKSKFAYICPPNLYEKEMDFRTVVDIPKDMPKITHSNNFLLLGSCFAENIGTLMTESKFACDVNPFGILYNPLSVSTALKQIINKKIYTDKDLFFYREQYHSYMHHGSFSAFTADDTLQLINSRLLQAHDHIPTLNYLFITFGTSWVYSLKENSNVVSNCHKQPASAFTRRRLSVDEIVKDYTGLLKELFIINPDLRIIFTVSPIRHIKDGLHGNQLSKAVLLLAIDRLVELFPDKIHYLPSYEIVVDELRDYRFYADDMLHPSSMAIEYIWERFAETFFSVETQIIIKECQSICKSLKHKPFQPESEQYNTFLEQIVLKIKRLKEKYPNLDVQKELEICHTLLKR